jgi:hypothetical protein
LPTRYIAEMTRYLRIAASGFFVLLAVALIGLWIWSHFYRAYVIGPVGRNFQASAEHACGIATIDFGEVPNRRSDWDWGCMESEMMADDTDQWRRQTWLGLGFSLGVGNGFTQRLPYWCLVVCSLGVATLLMFAPLRFSLRTLLIVTTVLSVVIGLIAYAVSRQGRFGEAPLGLGGYFL